MAYNGYFIKVNGVILPNSFIKQGTFKGTPHQLMDDNSYRDSKGGLHRTIVVENAGKATFTIISMDETKMQTFRQFITLENRKKCSCNYYCFDTGTYETEDMYIPDIEFTVYTACNGEVMYSETPISFIGYGKE